MGKFPDSADALVEDYEVDGDLVASDDEASDDDQGRAVAGPSKRRTLQAISDEEDDFALDDQEDYEESDGTREESEQEEDEYGLPVNRAVKAETERNASQALGTPATASKEDKKRKRREKTKEAKVARQSCFGTLIDSFSYCRGRRRKRWTRPRRRSTHPS